MLIDTHAHVYSKNFINDVEQILQRAKDAGISQIYLPAIDLETHEAMLQLEAKHPQYLQSMMGVHPCSINANYAEEMRVAENYLRDRTFCAVGEIGIDLYWDKTFLEEQKNCFIQQMHWAEDLKIPIAIHSRESMEITIAILEENKWYTQGGIFHCFTGNTEQAKRVIDHGFYLGIGGVVTYKNSGLDSVVRDIALDYMVLETDAPYLSPIPHRGKRNEPSYVKFVAQKIAEVKEVDYAVVAEVTTRNAYKIFTKKIKNYGTI